MDIGCWILDTGYYPQTMQHITSSSYSSGHPIIIISSHDDDNDENNPNPRQSQRRIHPAMYLVALVSAVLFCLVSVHGLSHYPSRSSHDELLVRSSNDRLGLSQLQDNSHASASGYSSTSYTTSATSWTSLANALGGFSTSFVHSPQLNVSWISRPAGFGPHITGQAGLGGKLETIAHSINVNTTTTIIDAEKAKKGCDISQFTTRLPSIHSQATEQQRECRIALVERGDCPFIVKLLNAQSLNYEAVIIYNDPAHATHPGGPFSGDYSEEDELISMWSPSREASKLHIPSVFVAYNTGRTLENLINIAKNHGEEFRIDLRAEEPPRLLLMDLIVMLFFLPTILTTVVIVLSKIRQMKNRQKQRAPQSLVDSLPSFKWREDLDVDIEALDVQEKGVEATSQEILSVDEGSDAVTKTPTTPPPHRSRRTMTAPNLSQFISKAICHASSAQLGRKKSLRPVIANPHQIRHLARKIFSQKECAICLADFVTDDGVRLLPCGHIFHVGEIDSWLTQQRRWCPVCRSPIDGDDIRNDTQDEEAALGHEGVAARATTTSGLSSIDNDDDRRHSDATHSSTAIVVPPPAQPIITREDMVSCGENEEEEYHPVAGSSGVNERTRLLPL